MSENNPLEVEVLVDKVNAWQQGLIVDLINDQHIHSFIVRLL